MYGCGWRGTTTVSSGKCNGRSFSHELMNGKIILTGNDDDGRPCKRVAIIKDGEVWDDSLMVDNKMVHRIVYGEFMKNYQNGREIVHFRKGTGMGKHGKARRNEKLFGHDGVCHSWYKQGRLVQQKFIYDNGRIAYNYKASSSSCVVRDYAGNVYYEIKGVLDGRGNMYYGGRCHAIISRKMEYWFNKVQSFEVKRRGRVVYAGQMENNQRTGKWILNGQAFYYEHGVAIPKKLFDTPSDQLNPVDILKINNAQLRMALMEKIGPDRIIQCGKIVHKDKEMRLYNIPKYDVRILRVQCPTTKSYYFLRVPKDTQKCEEARQWTFGVGEGFNEPIKFARET
jgi:hypothetical protein